MTDSEVKSKSSSVPNITISSEVFRTNVTAAVLRAPRLPRARLRVSSSVLGIRDRDYYESDEEGNVHYTGRKRKKDEQHARSTRRAKSAGDDAKEEDEKPSPEAEKKEEPASGKKKKKAKKPKLEGWNDGQGKPLKREVPPKKRVYKATRRKLWKQWVDFWNQYPLRIIRFIAVVLVFIYWVWLVLSFATKQGAKAADEFKPKKHGVISKFFRLPEYAFDTLSDKSDEEKELTIKMTIWGPFISKDIQDREYDQNQLETSRRYVMDIVLQRWTYPKSYQKQRTLTIQIPPQTQIEGGTGVSNTKLVMVNTSKVHERSALDYNDYPRNVKLDIMKSSKALAASEMTIYVLGFGVHADQTESIPFSYQVELDPITMRMRVMYGLLPLVVFITFLLFGVNRAIAAMFAVATSLSCFLRVGLGASNIAAATDYYEYDYIFFIFSVLVLGTLFAETNVQSLVAYYFLKATRMTIVPVLIFINVVPGALCFAMNNILITELMVPLVMRLFELMGHDATPGIMNTLMVCNMMGRAFIGTYASGLILRHHQATNVKEESNKLDVAKFLLLMAPLAGFVTVIIFVCYFLLFLFFKPYEYARMRQIEENEQLMRLCDITYASIPDFSKGWHRVRLKIQAMKAFFAFEIKEMRARVKKFGPEPAKSVQVRLFERRHQCSVHNWYLLIKCCVALGFYLLLIGVYIYNKKINKFHSYEEMRLGYIGLFAAMCAILMVHSRDLELLLKRVDWETIVVMACLTFIAKVFTEVCKHMPDFVWKMYGNLMKGDKKKKRHITVVNILALSALSGVANEYTIFVMFLDAAFEYSIFQGLNSYGEVLAAFYIGTGFWGMASPVGTTPNLVAVGQCYSQGYYHKVTFFKFMLWGLPTAILSVLLLYWGLLVRIFTKAED